MSLLVTGSIGIDTVQTPYGISKNCLGGSAVYFSMAASYFCPVRFIGVIGEDCPFDLRNVFKDRNVDLTGLEIRQNSKTFRWQGSYHNAMNEAITESVELNVLAEAPPVVPNEYKDSKFVFLANTAPALQNGLLDQIDAADFVAADSMNCWIENHKIELTKLLKRISAFIINEDEAKLLAGESNLIKAGKMILTMGPEVVIIKKGESGSLVLSEDKIFLLPAYPTSVVKDPTGAGDSFAGALMGYLSQQKKADFETIKTAVAYGTVAASFTISDFSLNGINSATKADIDKRFEAMQKFTRF